MRSLHSLLVSHAVPLELPSQERIFDDTSASIDPNCAWFNRAGDSNGVYTVPKVCLSSTTRTLNFVQGERGQAAPFIS